MFTTEDVLIFVSSHSWFKRHLRKVKKHIKYLDRVVNEMRIADEQEMNRVILSIPYEERNNGKGGAIVPEILTNYLSHLNLQ